MPIVNRIATSVNANNLLMILRFNLDKLSCYSLIIPLAERKGFEPPIPLQIYMLSKHAP